MSFHREDYAYLLARLVSTANDSRTLHALASNNLNIILAALDIAAADPAPSLRLSKAAPALLAACREALTLHEDDEGIAGVLYAAIASAEGEPEADGDRTVHPEMDRVQDTDLLRRVTELEKLANATAMFALSTHPDIQIARATRPSPQRLAEVAGGELLR